MGRTLFSKAFAAVALGLGLAMAVTAWAVLPLAAYAADEPVASSNAWANSYSWGRYGNTSKSALAVDASGNLERVEYVEDKGLVVETYTAGGKFVSGKVIDASTYRPSDLSDASKFCWGGVFCGESYNFVVTGQTNLGQDDSLKVLRFTEYDKNWELKAVVEANRINTYIPFDAGSCAMAESNGVLMVRTCHEMYQSSDGLHHQASMAFSFREGTMQPLSAMSGVMNIRQTSLGYVSHSFDQKLAVLNGTFYSLDLGDAYPRSAVVKKLGSTGSSSYRDVKSISGKTGDNDTYTTVGGLAASSTANTLLAVGTQRDQSAVYSASDYTDYPRNVWLTVMNASGLSVKKQVDLTSYAKGSAEDAENAQIVQTGDNEFLVVWGVKSGSERSHIDCVFVDGNGTVVEPAKSFSGELSDCQPIVTGGKVVWYATGYGYRGARGPVFYEMDIASRTAKAIAGAGKIPESSITCPESLTYTGSALTPDVTVSFGPLVLSEGADYTVSYADNVGPGTATVKVTGTGNYTGTVTKEFEIEVAEADEKAAEAVSDLLWDIPSKVENKADRKEVASVLAAYDKLTDVQKSLLSAEDQRAVKSARNALEAYDAAVQGVSTITINRSTVNAKTVKSTAKKAGASLGKVKTVVLGAKVKMIKLAAFKGCGAKTLRVKTTNLRKKSVKGSLKGSKVTKLVVDTGSDMADVEVAHYLTGAFTKANCGKKVTVVVASR